MKLTTLILLISLTAIGQGTISLGAYTDPSLILLEDQHGNTPVTWNGLFKVNLEGNQIKKVGYAYIPISYEYAALHGGKYQRYSGGIGFNFNDLFITKLEIGGFANYGVIIRYDNHTFSSFEFGGQLNYKLGRFKLSLLGSLTERKELLFRWGTNVIRFNGYVGLIYIFKRE